MGGAVYNGSIYSREIFLFDTYEAASKEREKYIRLTLQKHFRPEFLNRIDDIVLYNSLSESMLESIVHIFLRDIEKML